MASQPLVASSYVDIDPLAPGIEHVNRLIGQTLLFNVFGRARFDEDAVEG